MLIISASVTNETDMYSALTEARRKARELDVLINLKFNGGSTVIGQYTDLNAAERYLTESIKAVDNRFRSIINHDRSFKNED